MHDSNSGNELAFNLSQDQANDSAIETAQANPEFVAEQGGGADQPGNGHATDAAAAPATEEGKAKKQPETLLVLQTGKAAVKLYEGLIGFDKNADSQRATIRELLNKQSKAMENKMLGIKPGEGEDFDSLSKQLRKENNRLDSMLDGKDSLLTSTTSAIDAAIDALNKMKTRIIKMEEEG